MPSVLKNKTNQGEYYMTRGKKLCAFLVFICFLFPVLAKAKDPDKLKKQVILDQKKLVVMKNMEFTDEERDFFWPVFDKFQKKLFQVDDRAAKLVMAYAATFKTLTDDQAAIIVGEYFDIQKSRLELMDTYALKLSKGLPAKKVFRYLQIENKIDAGARYEIAKEIPLAE